MFDIQRIIRLDHIFKDLFVYLVFHVTNCECAYAYRFPSPGGERFSIIIDIDSLKPGRRHGIDIGRNEKFLCRE